MDIFGWLTHRAFHLPAAHDRLSTIFGPDISNAITGGLHTLLVDVVTSALGSLAQSAVSDANHIQDFVHTSITTALANVSPALADQLNTAVATGLGNAEQVALSAVANLATNVIDEVSKVLQLQ